MTQKQARHRFLEVNRSARRSRKTPRIPVVLTIEEVKSILSNISGISEVVTKLLYGSGLRISEAVRLRVQDVDFGYKQITVRDGKVDPYVQTEIANV